MPTLEDARAEAAGTDTAPVVEVPESQGKPAREPKAAKEPTACACKTPECTSTSKGKFAPGHDAKLVKHLTAQVVYGDMAVEDAEVALKEASGNSVLLLNKLRSSVERETGVKERKVRRDAAKSEASEAKTATQVDATALAASTE